MIIGVGTDVVDIARLSLSHDAGIASAVVIAEGEPRPAGLGWV